MARKPPSHTYQRTAFDTCTSVREVLLRVEDPAGMGDSMPGVAGLFKDFSGFVQGIRREHSIGPQVIPLSWERSLMNSTPSSSPLPLQRSVRAAANACL